MRITTTISNDKAVAFRLRLYARRFDHKEEMWSNIADVIATENYAWFLSQGRGTWPPLKAPKDKEYRGFGDKPLLVRTGRLLDSLTTTQELMDFNSDKLAILGTDVFYAEFHYTGTEDMPKRRPIIPLAEIREISKDIARDFVRYER